MGDIQKEKGDLDEALDHYKDTLKITKQIGELKGKAVMLSKIGRLLCDKGEIFIALNKFSKALEIFKCLGSPEEEIIEGYISEIMSYIKKNNS